MLPKKLIQFQDHFEDLDLLKNLKVVCLKAVEVGHEWNIKSAISVTLPEIFDKMNRETVNQILAVLLTDSEWLNFHYYIEEKLEKGVGND